jgi:hypothetical protein
MEDCRPSWRTAKRRIATCLWWFVPYERLCFKSRLSADSARHRAELFLRLHQPTNLERGQDIVSFDIHGRLCDGRFEFWPGSGAALAERPKLSPYPDEDEWENHNHFPFVSGEILPEPSGSVIRARMRLSYNKPLVVFVFVLLIFLAARDVRVFLGACGILYAFILMEFRVCSANAKAILGILFRASSDQVARTVDGRGKSLML